ncbi:electron transport complex subunit RsxB [Clostridium homopropionicum DSM 5847]|uniref:Electron transport complex subunit RsxB n=1 Tax=Clostridium homopropionicum DSM 5847 TaxID=1121318 RepID=A0A0L6Z6H0_9CLOT|nr:4Fe-4S binding protein [Clostridium homopropionicum]KOA18408.1 electron transport complex subunit RsxB [Clostridium homopropionicum DSM 5847]SFF67408.1 4Fe-4S binding domain-containing protein [Clostridium homopropionicum]
MKRRIITIDEKKCNGCGICVNACHEGAIQMIDGKAKLISDEYCDGLGDCLPGCPTGAIEIIEREAEEYNEEKVKQRMEEKKREAKVEPLACGCPGTMAKMIQKPTVKLEVKKQVKREEVETNEGAVSELMQWPVQLNLINPNAKFLEGADLLIAADCTAFAYANFHKDFIKGRITAIGCPKLDDNNHYKEKITQILRDNDIRSIKVIRMTVPCCGGIVSSVKSAMLEANKIIPYSEVIIDVNGEIVQNI